MSNTDTNARILDALVDQQLSAVIFIQDYLQLDFDGKRLTVNVWPAVFLSGKEFQIGHVGYRDALCELISRQVTSTSERQVKSPSVSTSAASPSVLLTMSESNG